MVGGTLYVSTSLGQVAALDAATGKTRWVHDPRAHDNTVHPANNGWANMGVAYWKGGTDERVFILTADAFLVALDALTGKPAASFGDNGGSTSPRACTVRSCAATTPTRRRRWSWAMS
jgi:quinoprotein glucose dehydrogenase